MTPRDETRAFKQFIKDKNDAVKVSPVLHAEETFPGRDPLTGETGSELLRKVVTGHTIELRGTKGGLEWAQSDPNYLWYTPYGQPKQLLTRGGAGALPDAGRVTRVPSGHPEGYLEGFATIYAEAARTIRAATAGVEPDPAVSYPTVHDGLAGMKFIDAAVRSSAANGAWVRLDR